MQMYFVAIVLPSHLNEKLLAYKQLMLEKYNCKVALKSPAHITLVPPFWMEEEKEQQHGQEHLPAAEGGGDVARRAVRALPGEGHGFARSAHVARAGSGGLRGACAQEQGGERGHG